MRSHNFEWLRNTYERMSSCFLWGFDLKTRTNTIIVILVMFLITTVAGCSEKTTEDPQVSGQWKDMELKDVRTGEVFKVSDFEGKTILIESFAVWCPTCLKQQKEVKILTETEDENVIHIALDTDPNEDEQVVLDHVESNDFNWYYAVSPVEYTQALIDDFGVTVVNAPSAPMILVCEDQSTRFLRTGVKSADDLQNEIYIGCA